ncbi:GntR family transcriptional regulator [Sedimentitalea sp. XS_ASV28]|uniref:GntR family transcriptional regulator n=1 Tax=Sedimentitalea sp. XS_ASV28 TaxID=3241296 RepID=UPI003512E87A
MNQANEVNLLADKAQGALWAALRSGRLQAGQFLSMTQLVQLLDCPIAAIRDAVKHASSHGLLSTLPKRGIQVMEARPETIRDCLDFRMVLDQEGARRRIARKAFDGLRELRVQHAELQAAAREDSESNLSPRAIDVDLSLHDFLAEGLGNSQLCASYEANRMRIAVIQNARPFLQVRIVSAMDEHLAVIDAVQQRDAKAAVDAIRYHYEQTLRWWGAV